MKPTDIQKLHTLPIGWQSLVEELVEDLLVLIDKYELTNFEITDAKEKWGRMTVYFDGVTSEAWEELVHLESRYGQLSAYTCMSCGKATTRRKGYALCGACAAKYD